MKIYELSRTQYIAHIVRCNNFVVSGLSTSVIAKSICTRGVWILTRRETPKGFVHSLEFNKITVRDKVYSHTTIPVELFPRFFGCGRRVVEQWLHWNNGVPSRAHTWYSEWKIFNQVQISDKIL